MSFIIGLAQWLGSFMPKLRPEVLFDKSGRLWYDRWYKAMGEGACCEGERCGDGEEQQKRLVQHELNSQSGSDFGWLPTRVV